MSERQTHAKNRRHAGGAALVAALLLTALIAIAWPKAAESAPATVVLLGKTASTPPPDCPRNCLVEGRVTGFQYSTSDGTVKPFEAPFEGKIVSWSITLGNPQPQDETFFNDVFEPPAQARISVIKRIGQTRPPQYKLVRQSPVHLLKPYFGETISFALEHPLTVLRDQIVALTVPTWAPMFASCPDTGPCAVTNEDTWRGSRRKGRCSFSPTLTFAQLKGRISESHPQQRTKSTRSYECFYTVNRLLYTATVVKKPGGR